MKCVERDADRQKEIEPRRVISDPAARQRPLEVLQQKVPVFKKAEHAQVYRDADHEPDLARFGLRLFSHDPAEVEVHRGGSEKERGKGRIPRAVKNVTRHDEEIFARGPGAQHPIRAHHHREKDDEGERVEKHALRLAERPQESQEDFAACSVGL